MIIKDCLEKKETNCNPLKEIFEKSKFNYKFIKFIIFSMPKTGSISLYNSFKNLLKENEEIIHFHTIVELIIHFGNEIAHYNIYEIIDFFKKNSIHEKIYIFSSYRKPTSRYLSFYYHNLIADSSLENTLIAENNEVNIFQFYYQVKSCYRDMYKELLNKEFNIQLENYEYDKKNGCFILNYNEKITWFFTCLEDFNKLESFLKNYNEDFKNITFLKDNENLIYKEEMKKKYFENFSKIAINNEEKKILKFYKYFD